MYEALADYIEKSETRIADTNVCICMSPGLAEKYDDGVYDFAVSEHVDCIRELVALNLMPDNNKKFYIYLVPDDEFIKLLEFPYKNDKKGGLPVRCFHRDGLRWAFGSSQNLFVSDNISQDKHINLLHEYSHLIENEFGLRHLLFNEGFADLIPWYVLGYEDKSTTHIEAVLSTNIYTAGDILMTKDIFNDVVPDHICSFQRSYISSYVFVRTLIEKMQQKYNLDKIGAVTLWLDWMKESKFDKTFLVIELARKLGMDVEKLLETTEYQKEVLKKMSDNVKMRTISTRPMEVIKR